MPLGDVMCIRDQFPLSARRRVGEKKDEGLDNKQVMEALHISVLVCVNGWLQNHSLRFYITDLEYENETILIMYQSMAQVFRTGRKMKVMLTL